MPRITKVYTRTGDDGSTGLGSGQRTPKDALRVATYGTIDELNAHIGTTLAAQPAADLIPSLRQIQNELFHLGADLCIPPADKQKHPGPQIEARHIAGLESCIDKLSPKLPAQQNFILPGGSPAAAQLYLASTVCRRAERLLVTLAREAEIGPHILPYVNRLSDALFVMARYQNNASGIEETLWDSRA